MKTTHLIIIGACLAACSSCTTTSATPGAPAARAANAVAAPASLEGATIKIQGYYDPIKIKNNRFETGERPIVYIPYGSKAKLQGDYGCANGTGSRIWEMYLSGILPAMEEYGGYEYEKTTPATITFTSKVGKVYTGVVNGYMVCNRTDYGDGNSKLSNTPVTITLP